MADFVKYEVRVYKSGIEWRNERGRWHREDGPAIEYSNGRKSWYINGQRLTEKEFLARTKKTTFCQGKVVEIDGKKYKLTEV